jgi:hypothetical protein
VGNRATIYEAGIVELATNAETVTGTDTARAVTPAGVAAAFATPPSMGAVTATELNVATGTITVSNPVLDATQTWNNGGVTFTGIKANITDTASAAASLLEDLQVGGSSKYKVSKAGTVTIAGDIDHDGSNVGFFGVTPAARPSALTQTYSTASATHSNPTATALTHTAVAGTTDGTLVDCTGTYSEAAVEENFKELAVAINNLITDVANVKQFLNQVVDQLQTLGLLQ